MDTRDPAAGDTTVRTGVPVPAAGRPAKTILEYAGRLASGDEAFSVAVMRSPAGWTEPTQVPDFRELTLVCEGRVLAHLHDRSIEVPAGHAIDVAPGTPVRYETPEPAVYVALCLPAFSPELAHRADTGPEAPAASP